MHGQLQQPLTACAAALMLLPLMCSKHNRGKHRETLQKQWKGIVAIGAFMAANIALNNTSLVRAKSCSLTAPSALASQSLVTKPHLCR